MIRELGIGGRHPISVQSMTKTDTRNVNATLSQITRLRQAGCEIVRIAIPDAAAADAFREIRRRTRMPLVADIHFDYRLAIKALDSGADKIRINPGNIGSKSRVRDVIRCAADHGVPIRIGVNSGSIEKDLLRRFRSSAPRAMVASVRRWAAFFEANRYRRIVLSAKAADALETIETYEALSRRFRYPLHLGVTEAGLAFRGGIRSAVGLSALLYSGIGDTIRVSLTGDPVSEVVAGFEILRSLGLRRYGPILISCPTCGRCEIDLVRIAQQVEDGLNGCTRPIKIAVMGCPVNGPGEARAADFGLAGGRGSGVIFRQGKVVRIVKQAGLVDALLAEIDRRT
jgi:(E)-4-hydroxy-3-methylbut-2-enyl-diphosphate synthase